jgi:hypothetical protein
VQILETGRIKINGLSNSFNRFNISFDREKGGLLTIISPKLFLKKSISS